VFHKCLNSADIMHSAGSVLEVPYPLTDLEGLDAAAHLHNHAGGLLLQSRAQPTQHGTRRP
jgi:hypothetical protein